MIRLRLFITVASVLAYLSVYSTVKNDVGYLGIEHGLSNNYVTKIFQDRHGFMWFGTYDGLNRYDGYQFKVYKNQPQNPASLPGNRIIDIIEDASGHLWVATKGGAAVLRKGTDTFHQLHLTTDNGEYVPVEFAITGFALRKDHRLFAAGERGGLFSIRFSEWSDPIAEPIPLLVDGTRKTNYNAQALHLDTENRLWVMAQNAGLCYYDEQINAIRVVSDEVRTATCMEIINGQLWVGNEYGLFQYQQQTKKYRHYTLQSGLPSNVVSALYEGKDGRLWICTDGGGIAVLNTQSGVFDYLTGSDDGGVLTSKAVFAVYEDAQSRQWIGTLRGGITVIDRNKGNFELVKQPTPEGIISANNFVLSFAEGDAHTLWVGTDGGGLMRWDREADRYAYFKQNGHHGALSSNYVTSVLRDNKNGLWAATYGGGINRWDPQTQSFISYTCTAADSLTRHRYVWKLHEDKQNRVWATTLNGGGIYLLNRKTDRFEPFAINVTDALSIWEEDTDLFWFGNYSALIRADMATRSTQHFDIGHPVRCIHQGTGNLLWVGTEGGGLLAFDKLSGTYKRYTAVDGLPSNVVLNILEDNDGSFWISTYNGLSKFDPANRTFQNFYESDGLQSNQFSYNAALRLTSGEFVFGGIRGFNIFHPDSLRFEAGTPPVVLTDLRINNQPFNSDPEQTADLLTMTRLVLPFQQAVLTFSFAALEYAFPDKISYAYFLEGWDSDWNYVDGQRTAHYSRLAEGSYTLRIKSTNANGVWGDNERTIAIEVLPPWWRTVWAYCLYIIAGLSGLYVYIVYDRRQTKLKYEVALARKDAENERTLNEKKLAFFTHISHEFRTPLTLIVNPIKDMLYSDNKVPDTEELSNVYRNSRRLLSLVDKLLLFRKADSGADKLRLVRLDLVTLCNEVFLCFKQHAASRKLAYQFNCDIPQLEILGDREKLEICLFNLISNAIKFTPEQGCVTMALSRVDNGVDIVISDTGCGIPAHVGDAVFSRFYREYEHNGRHAEGFGIGLFLTKQFIEAHKGTISYTSTLQKGTSFRLRLPVGKDQFDGHLVFEDVGEHSVFLNELLPDAPAAPVAGPKTVHRELTHVSNMVSDHPVMLVVDDNDQIRAYIRQLFENDFTVYDVNNGPAALELAKSHEPDIVISDVVMEGLSGIDLCAQLKQDPLYSHIPVILLTASSSAEVKLQGIAGGADDYITKPFDKDLLVARVTNIRRSRDQLQKYFYDEITFQNNDHKIPAGYSDFLKRCIEIVEKRLDSPDLNVKVLADEIGMSHSNLYKRIKSISGKSANEFIRFIRLRKVAQLLITTNHNISEAAFSAGFNDIKYFRDQFTKLFGMKPSAYKRKYGKVFSKKHTLKKG